VSYYDEELKHKNTDIDASILHNARASSFVIKACEVKEAIEKLKLHESDGGFMLSSDYFVNAGFDLSIHISFIFHLYLLLLFLMARCLGTLLLAL